MSRIEVLFRDSSNQDGVQSRGAGWHPRAVSTAGSRCKPAALAGELTRGDLIKSSSKPGCLQVHDGQRLLPVDPPTHLESDHPSFNSWMLSLDPKGDWDAFWNAGRDAGDLLWLARMMSLDHPQVVEAACACAETVLRLVPREEQRPRRALRVARRWLVGAATVEAVERAFHAATSAPYNLGHAETAARQAARSAHFASRTVLHSRSAYSCAHAAADAITNDTDGFSARSLSFLVRIQLPSWRVCLANVQVANT